MEGEVGGGGNKTGRGGWVQRRYWGGGVKEEIFYLENYLNSSIMYFNCAWTNVASIKDDLYKSSYFHV